MSINPALAALDVLEGNWEMELSGAAFQHDHGTTVTVPVTIGWIEGGAALVMRQADAATWIFGRDETQDEFRVFYSDSRGVSRVYNMLLADDVWTLWRNASGFSQRFSARIAEDGQSISGAWEKSFDGVAWEHDFNVTYRRSDLPDRDPRR
jgi:hypothetical protein